MPLRCLLFTSDEATAQPLWRVITELGMEGEHCRQAVEAVERLSNQSFHIVIADWDDEPEASFLLKTARELKAAQRPLTLAIVRNEAIVPKALQAGANSILRKPIVPAQVKDTLSTARDLLRAKLESAAPKAQAAAASAASTPAGPVFLPENAFRAGEILQPGVTKPSAQFDTEPEIPSSHEPASHGNVTRATELQPTVTAVAGVETPAKTSSQPKRESRSAQSAPAARLRPLPPITLAATPSAPQNDVLSYSETAHFQEVFDGDGHSPTAPHPEALSDKQANSENDGSPYNESEKSPDPRRTSSALDFRKPLLIAALALACAFAVLKVPRPLWKQNLRVFYTFVAHSGRELLNPKTAAPQQAPAAHENFGQAGDEYKLPVVENIPDATTDPSQIHVLPVVDPTLKATNGSPAGAVVDNPGEGSQQNLGDISGQSSGRSAGQSSGQGSGQAAAQTAQTDHANPASTDQDQSATHQQQGPPTLSPNSPINSPSAVQSERGSDHPLPAAVPTQQPPTAPPSRNNPVSAGQAQIPSTQSHPFSTGTEMGIPGSLRSQMTSTTPEASGNKPIEAALPSIGPVDLPEYIARSLLAQQVDPTYPESARASRQQGTVVLQVTIARDGSVEDAKFLQGSLVFAKAAIDAVKQWRFRPYSMNGRPAEARTTLTVSFKPTP